MMNENRHLHPPTEEELLFIGFERWQINSIRRLDAALQWEVYYEYIRLVMSGDDVEGPYF